MAETTTADPGKESRTAEEELEKGQKGVPGESKEPGGQEGEGKEDGQEKTYGEDYVRDLRKEAADRRVENKELKERLSALEAERKAQSRKDTEAAEKSGEFERLYNEMKPRAEALEEEVRTLKEKAVRFDEYQTARKKEILSTLPREEARILEDLSLEKLEDLVKARTKRTGSTSIGAESTETPTKGAGDKGEGQNGSLSAAQLDAIRTTDPDRYKVEFEKYKKTLRNRGR